MALVNMSLIRLYLQLIVDKQINTIFKQIKKLMSEFRRRLFINTL